LIHYSGAPAYGAPHWNDENKDGDVDDEPHTKAKDRNFSVAFVASKAAIKDKKAVDSFMDVGAKFEAIGLPISHGFKITANLDSTNGEKDLDKADCTDAASIITLPGTETKKPFKDSVQFYDRFNKDAFKATWTINFDSTSLEAGKTEHQIYVTLSKPNPSKTYEDIFYHACKNSADLDEEEKDLKSILDGDFKNLRVSRFQLKTGKDDVDYNGMNYWGPFALAAVDQMPPPQLGTKFLMDNGDGSCGDWAPFFADIAKAHGIKGIVRNIGMKHLVFPPGGGYPNALYAPRSLYIKKWVIKNGIPDRIKYTPAQGNKSPRDRFSSAGHCIYFYKNIIYDPSYGKKYTTLTNWVKGSVSIVEYTIDDKGTVDLADDVIFTTVPTGSEAIIFQYQ
jgi:hypothetical protein